MPLLASLATIPAEITLLSFTKENKTEYNSQLFHIALIKGKNIQYLEPSIVTSKGYDDDDDDNNDDHEGEENIFTIYYMAIYYMAGIKLRQFFNYENH